METNVGKLCLEENAGTVWSHYPPSVPWGCQPANQGSTRIRYKTWAVGGSRDSPSWTVPSQRTFFFFFFYLCFTQGELLQVTDSLLLSTFHKNALILPSWNRQKEHQVWGGLLYLCSYEGSRPGRWFATAANNCRISTKFGEPCQSHESTQLSLRNHGRSSQDTKNVNCAHNALA